MLTALAFTIALAQDAPRLSDGFRGDPVSIRRFERAQDLAYVGLGVTFGGYGLALVGAFIGATASFSDDAGGKLLGGVVFDVGIASAVVGPGMLYGFGGHARGALRHLGLDVPGAMTYTALGLWGGGWTLIGLSFLPSSPTGLVTLGSVMHVTAFVLGALQLGVNRRAATGAGIAGARHERPPIAVAPWTDGYRTGALIAVGF